jgi:hypothetical protein
VVVAPCYIANLSGPVLITDPSQVNFTINVGVNDINGQNAAGATAVYYDANGGLAADPTPPQTQNQNNAAALLASGNAPIALNPGGPVIVTNSTTTYVSGYVDTPVAQRVDQYSTTIEAVLNGGSTVYSQTFSVPYGDAAVQAAIALADSILAGDSATYGSPYQTANSTILTGSQLTYQVTGQSLSGAVEASTFSTFGPDYVAVGDNQSELFVISAGQIDINLNNEFFYNTDRNAITTNTYLTSQTYEIDGTTQSPTVPEPKSALLLLAAAALALLLRGTLPVRDKAA